MSTASSTPRRYGGRSADDRRSERRARLVVATVDVLGERGLNATTMTSICAEAGLTERYFYESFTNREAALVTALDAVSEEIAAVAVQAIADTEGPATERVHAALRALVAWVDAHPGAARVALVESNAHPDLRTRRRDRLSSFADLVATEAARLYGAEAWPQPRARAQGMFYVAGLAELFAARSAGDVDLSADELIAIGAESFARLAVRPPTAE